MSLTNGLYVFEAKRIELSGKGSVRNLELDRENDFNKSVYFKMLAAVLKQGKEVSKPQKDWFRRLIAGVDCSYTMEEYFALELTIRELKDIATEFELKDIGLRFILDALVLAYLGGEQEKQLTLIQQYAEAFHISQKVLREYQIFAKALVLNELVSFFRKYTNGSYVNQNDIYDYLEATEDLNYLTNGLSFDDDNYEGFYMGSPREPNLGLENMVFDVAVYPVTFREYQSVELTNCVFIGGGKHSVVFENCEEVRLKFCTFQNFSTKVIMLNNVKAGLDMEETIFKNCVYHCKPEENCKNGVGVLLYSEHPESVGESFLQSCTFTYCRGTSNTHQHITGVLSNCKTTALTCLFDKCGFYVEDADGTAKKVNIFEDLLTAESSVISCRVSMPQENIDRFERELVQNRKKKWRKGKKLKTAERENISEAGERR